MDSLMSAAMSPLKEPSEEQQPVLKLAKLESHR